MRFYFFRFAFMSVACFYFYFAKIELPQVTIKNPFVTILSGHDSVSSVTLEIFKNHGLYSKTHNYKYYYFSEEGSVKQSQLQGSQWRKLDLILSEFKETNCSWIMWIDSDAVFVNMTKSIETLLFEHNVSNSVDFIFAGDTYIMNSGAMLMRKSDWMLSTLHEIVGIGLTLEHHPRVGMGYDNAAIMMYLTGCNASSPIQDLKACFQLGDSGLKNSPMKGQIMEASPQLFESLVPISILSHIKPVPHNDFNCYVLADSKFIYHFPNRRRHVKEARLKEVLDYLNFTSSAS